MPEHPRRIIPGQSSSQDTARIRSCNMTRTPLNLRFVPVCLVCVLALGCQTPVDDMLEPVNDPTTQQPDPTGPPTGDPATNPPPPVPVPTPAPTPPAPVPPPPALQADA